MDVIHSRRAGEPDDEVSLSECVRLERRGDASMEVREKLAAGRTPCTRTGDAAARVPSSPYFLLPRAGQRIRQVALEADLEVASGHASRIKARPVRIDTPPEC